MVNHLVQTAKVALTNGWLNHPLERLRSLSIAISSHVRGFYIKTIVRCYVSKVPDHNYYLPIALSVRGCVNKFACYDGEPNGSATHAANLRSDIQQVDW